MDKPSIDSVVKVLEEQWPIAAIHIRGLMEENQALQARVEKLELGVKTVLLMEDLWLHDDESPQHYNESVALRDMHSMLSKLAPPEGSYEEQNASSVP